jgi:uncharacterized membrane protein (UPF0127 family)
MKIMSKGLNHQNQSSRTKRWLLAAIMIVVMAALALMFIPRSQQASPHASVAPMFTKEGEVKITRRDGTNAVTIDVEIADTRERRETGLMGRPTMEERQGMLFIFEDEQPLSFWMKDTLLPLDMFFVNADGTISTIHRNTTPYSEQTYPSRRPGKFVLETDDGFADKYGVTEGDRIVWKRTK